MSNRTWEVICWGFTILIFTLLGAAGCAPRRQLNHEALISGVQVVDLSGRTVDPFELMEALQVFVTAWDKAKISSADDTWNAMLFHPVVAYLPPAKAIQCAHAIDVEKGIACIGMSSEKDVEMAMFLVADEDAHIGCSSLIHEMAHRLLLLQKKDGDGTHKKNPHVWGFGGVLDEVKLQLGCNYAPTNLREWR
jgi:hypothetical protein